MLFNFNQPEFLCFIDLYELRFISTKDAQMIADFYARNKDFLQPWEPNRSEKITEKSYWKARLRSVLESQEKGDSYSFVLKNKDQIIGIINLFSITRGSFDAAKISYSIDKNYLKQGLAFKSLQEILGFAFRTLKLHQVIAAYMPKNQASAAVLKKLNFKQIGLAQSYLEINGQWEDHILTQLINPFH